MAFGNLKVDGWAQGLYEISSTRKEVVGSLRITQDGRKYRYAKAGATALVAGKMTAAPVVDTDFYHKTGVAHSIGATEITVTIVATGTAYAEDSFSGGYLLLEDQLVKYPILSSGAIGTSDTSVVIQLAEPLHVAITASIETQLVPSPWMAVVQNSTEECIPTGVPEVAVTASYYCWVQTGGLSHCLTISTPTVGTMLIPSSTTGGLGVLGGVAASGATLTVETDYPYCAIAWGSGTASDAQPVFLIID